MSVYGQSVWVCSVEYVGVSVGVYWQKGLILWNHKGREYNFPVTDFFPLEQKINEVDIKKVLRYATKRLDKRNYF